MPKLLGIGAELPRVRSLLIPCARKPTQALLWGPARQDCLISSHGDTPRTTLCLFGQRDLDRLAKDHRRRQAPPSCQNQPNQLQLWSQSTEERTSQPRAPLFWACRELRRQLKGSWFGRLAVRWALSHRTGIIREGVQRGSVLKVESAAKCSCIVRRCLARRQYQVPPDSHSRQSSDLWHFGP